MKKIWVSGSLAYDRIMNYGGRFADHIDPEKIHVISLSFVVDSLNLSVGGVAGNIAYNLAMLSEKPEVIGNLGRDGKDYSARMKKLGIGVACVRVIEDKLTAGASTITDLSDNQITGFFAGAMYAPGSIPKSTSKDLAIIGAEFPANMVRLAKLYTKKKTFYIFDPAQQIPAFSKSQLITGMRGASLIIGNDYEIALITKKLGLRRSPSSKAIRQSTESAAILSKRLLRFARNDKTEIVTTLGEKGSLIVSNRRTVKIPVVRVKKVVDPTGAGDAYRAGLIKGLVLGYSYEQAGRLASLVASKAVQKYGTQNHKFSWKSIKKEYNKKFKSL